MEKGNDGKTLKDVFQYYLDLWLSKGTLYMGLLLFLITGIVILILSGLISIFCASRGLSFSHIIWQTLNHTLDPGVLSGDDGTALFLFIMLLATLCGVFFTALLIGVVNDGISSRMSELSKGLMPVIENDHVVVLGFNESTFIIIGELIEAYANQTRTRNVIVVMDKNDKQEMEERIRSLYPDTGNLKVVCRSGDSFNKTDLNRCSVMTSKAIIVALENDFDTIKAIIACTKMLNESEDSKSFVTAVINQRINEYAARIAGNDQIPSLQSISTKNDRLELLLLENTIARIMTHTSRQMGLSKVFVEIFNYSGKEIYIVNDEYKDVLEKLRGKTIREMNQYLLNAIAIGIIDSQGKVIIDDPNEIVLEENCKLIAVEEDDNKILLRDSAPKPSYTAPTKAYEDNPNTIVIVDCNSKLPAVLEDMGNYLSPGSNIYLVAPPEELDEVLEDEFLESLHDSYDAACITINRYVTEENSNLNIYKFKNFEKVIDDCKPDSMLIMSSQTDDSEEADTRALNLLLYCKHYKDLHPKSDFSVTCEMRNVQGRNLAETVMASDFIVSRNIAALMMSQIAEHREVKDVFESLLVSDGYEVYIKPAHYYLDIRGETTVDLFSISDAVAEKQEIFIGYKLKDEDAVLTPEKVRDGNLVTVTLSEGDQLVVLAEYIST